MHVARNYLIHSTYRIVTLSFFFGDCRQSSKILVCVSIHTSDKLSEKQQKTRRAREEIKVKLDQHVFAFSIRPLWAVCVCVSLCLVPAAKVPSSQLFLIQFLFYESEPKQSTASITPDCVCECALNRESYVRKSSCLIHITLSIYVTTMKRRFYSSLSVCAMCCVWVWMSKMIISPFGMPVNIITALFTCVPVPVVHSHTYTRAYTKFKLSFTLRYVCPKSWTCDLRPPRTLVRHTRTHAVFDGNKHKLYASLTTQCALC